MDKEERKQLSDSLQMDSDLHITTFPPPPPHPHQPKNQKKKKFPSLFFSVPSLFLQKNYHGKVTAFTEMCDERSTKA